MRGFSLLELMMVLLIGAILSVTASVTYQHSALRAKRVEAKVGLLDLSASMENYYLLHHTYQGAAPVAELMSEHPGYALKISSASDDAYLLSATPLFEDADCGVFMLDQLGQKQISGNASFETCWS